MTQPDEHRESSSGQSPAPLVLPEQTAAAPSAGLVVSDAPVPALWIADNGLTGLRPGAEGPTGSPGFSGNSPRSRAESEPAAPLRTMR